MIPSAHVATILTQIEADLAKLLDTDAETVDVHDVRIIRRRVQAQLEMIDLGLLTPETPQ